MTRVRVARLEAGQWRRLHWLVAPVPAHHWPVVPARGLIGRPLCVRPSGGRGRQPIGGGRGPRHADLNLRYNSIIFGALPFLYFHRG